MASSHLLHVSDLEDLRDGLLRQYGPAFEERVSMAVASAFGHSCFAGMTKWLGVRGVPVQSFDADAFLSELGDALLTAGMPLLNRIDRTAAAANHFASIMATNASVSWMDALERAAGLCCLIGLTPDEARSVLEGSHDHLVAKGRHVERASMALHVSLLEGPTFGDGEMRIERLRRRNPAAILIDAIDEASMAQSILQASRAHLVVVDLGTGTIGECLARLGDPGRVEHELLCALVRDDLGIQAIRVRD